MYLKPNATHFVLLDGTNVLEVNHRKHGIKYILVDADVCEKIKDRHIGITVNGDLKKRMYPTTYDGKRSITLHRFVMGNPKGKAIDHINTDDTFDARRSNLRIATQQQNTFNSSKRIGIWTSKYKGVRYSEKTRGHWYASITVNYKGINLGHYDTEHEAAIAYNNAAIHYFGEFARLNIISEEFKNITPIKKKKALNKGDDCPLSKRVNQYTLDGKFIKTWGSITEIRREIGIRVTPLKIDKNGTRQRNRKSKAKQFKWEFV